MSREETQVGTEKKDFAVLSKALAALAAEWRQESGILKDQECWEEATTLEDCAGKMMQVVAEHGG